MSISQRNLVITVPPFRMVAPLPNTKPHDFPPVYNQSIAKQCCAANSTPIICEVPQASPKQVERCQQNREG